MMEQSAVMLSSRFFFVPEKVRNMNWSPTKNLSTINVPNKFRKVGIKRELNCNSEISKTRCSSCLSYVHWNRRTESYLWDYSVGSVNVIHDLDTNLNLNRPRTLNCDVCSLSNFLMRWGKAKEASRSSTFNVFN